MELDPPHELDMPLSIALVTDLHYADAIVGSRYCRESLSKLKQAVQTFREREPDLLVHLGDSLDTSPTLEAERVCVNEIMSELATLDCEAHVLLGNHDVQEFTRDEFLEACGIERPSTYFSFDHKGVHIVVLDTNFNADGSAFSAGNFEWNDAWIGEPQIAWLRADLAAAGSAPTLVFTHANLDDRRRENGALDGHVVRDAAAVRAVLEASGSVRAVLQGHCHSGPHSVIHGIPYVTLRAMVEGSGLEQNAYALLSWMRDEDIVIEGFGQQASLRISSEDGAVTVLS